MKDLIKFWFPKNICVNRLGSGVRFGSSISIVNWDRCFHVWLKWIGIHITMRRYVVSIGLTAPKRKPLTHFWNGTEWKPVKPLKKSKS